MIENISDINSTNLFNTPIGTLNIAPIKISGQYKIVMDINQKLWLDNYNGRRVAIDTTNPIIPQISNFLSTKTTIVEIDQLRYGGFSKRDTDGKIAVWHIPLYLGNSKSTYPKYFVLSQLNNESNLNQEMVFEYGKIKLFRDISILHGLFDEIFAEEYYEFPLFLNFEQLKLTIFGCSILNQNPTQHSIELSDILANQNYFDVVNNRILNSFVNNDIFFPKFINLEFEFSLEHSIHNIFNNFFGFLSNKVVKENHLDIYNNYYGKLGLQTETSLDFQQIPQLHIQENIPIILNDYLKISGRFALQDITQKPPRKEYVIDRIDVGDEISITDYDNKLIFQYFIKDTDIVKTSLYETLINIVVSCNKKSGRLFKFGLKETIPTNSSFTLIIENNVNDIFEEEYSINVPWYFITKDRIEGNSNYYSFRSVKETDVWITSNQILSETEHTVKINNNSFEIIEYFYYSDLLIIRFDNNPHISVLTYAEVYETFTEELLELTPINKLSYYSQLKSVKQFSQPDYIEWLRNYQFAYPNDEILQKALSIFEQKVTDSIYQYVDENEPKDDLVDYPLVDVNNNQDNNEISVLDLIFGFGNTTFFTPNTINFDKRFFIQNGNPDIEKLNQDKLKFNWFLILGECPEYLKNTAAELRYFEDIPKITSPVITANKRNSETVFLGIKYLLPLEYDGYSFAVYIDINNPSATELFYQFKINHDLKTIYLSINKYLDFNDLIRGGDSRNKPLVDLSFFYSCVNGFNQSSNFLYYSIPTGINICDPIKETDMIMFENNHVWGDFYKFSATDQKWYICIKRNIYFEGTEFDGKYTAGMAETEPLYIYSSVTIPNEIGIDTTYTYKTMEFVFKGVKYVEPDYMWVEDIEVKFFDDKSTLFITEYNQIAGKDEIKIIRDKHLNVTIGNSTNPMSNFPEYEKYATVTINNQSTTIRLLAPEVTLSLKQYYFEIDFQETNTVFYFPEFYLANETDQQIINRFDYFDADSDRIKAKLTLFNRNQIWRLIKDIILTEAKSKTFTESQVKYMLNDYSIVKLHDYIKQTPIQIKDTEPLEYINLQMEQPDKNIVIWNLFNQIKIVLINRIKTAYFPQLFNVNNLFDFQLLKYKNVPEIDNYVTDNPIDRLFNIYSPEFGNIKLGTNVTDNLINATSLWDEVNSIVSSLYVKNNPIILTTQFNEKVDILELLRSYYGQNVDSLFILNNNENYIKKIDANINKYIINKYINMVLEKFYELDNISNELGQRLDYSKDTKFDTILYFKPIYKYTSNFKNLIFTFKRK